MEKAVVIKFLNALGCENIQIKSSSDWVRSSCPLAPWFHEDEDDKRPYFAVRAISSYKKPPVYHCFTCGNSGLLPRLMHNLQWCSNRYYKGASKILSACENLGEDTEPKRGRRKIIVPKSKYENVILLETRKNLAVPPDILNRYPLVSQNDSAASQEVHDWLVQSYQIPSKLIEVYNLRIYIEPVTMKVGVIFPIYDRKAEKVMDLWVKMFDDGRFFRLSPGMTGSDVEYKSINLWFGNQFFKEDRPMVLVSGPLGVLKLRSFGIPNVWASMINPLTLELIRNIETKAVYVAFDNDWAGVQSAKKTLKNISTSSRYFLNWRGAGIKGPHELTDIKHFRQVFDNRIRFENMD